MAVNTGEVAMPDVLVATVAVAPPPAKVPLAPEAGALNTTLMPAIPLPPESLTVATSGAKGAPTFTLWPPPDVTMMLLALPAVFAKANVAWPETLAVDAVTL